MKLYGLTGGMGMGKSACADWLRQQGVPLVDTDALARQLVGRGEPALAEIAQRFGAEVLDPEGKLRRDQLARLVFDDPQARRDLEAILHPRIRSAWKQEARNWADHGYPRGVVVIPLLYEVAADREVEAVICVACSAPTQRQRLEARGWSAEEIRRRSGAQWPVEDKIARAAYVIWTEGGFEVTQAQLRSILLP